MHWTEAAESATVSAVKKLLGLVALVFVAALGSSPLSGQSASLVVYGDVVYFYPPGNARNCISNNRFKRGRNCFTNIS